MASYPPPPDFYKLYGRDEEAPKPPPPVVGSYTAFGAEHSTEFVEPPFGQSMMYRRDGPGVDLREELKSLNKELLERFIALTNDVIENPSAYERRVEEITLLFNNMHHLLNAIRPSQAYATLEHVLIEQLKQKRERLQAVRDAAAAAESALEKTPGELAKAVQEATKRAEEARAGAAPMAVGD
jgi:mediator of RNA polymerase II transcription subunit 7